MKHKRLKTALLILLILLTLCFIFSNSMQSIPESSARSHKLLAAIKPALEVFVGEGNATNHLLRKLAHFAEFFVLGLELCALCVLVKKPLNWALFAGLLAALCDETIQIFYERGSGVQDVWLDFSAVAAAAVIVFLFKKRRGKDRK